MTPILHSAQKVKSSLRRAVNINNHEPRKIQN
jgi:hypothetical protein